MNPLNPFLRAFFRSTLPEQCRPFHSYILLVPSTDSLVYAMDLESRKGYLNLVASEEFLESHVLKIPHEDSDQDKDGQNPPDSKSKSNQISTFNGRSVIFKKNAVWTSKGFKFMAQAQILYDVLYYEEHSNLQPWLIYYISRPLIGQFARVSYSIPPPSPVDGVSKNEMQSYDNYDDLLYAQEESKSFEDIMKEFPLIARQMGPSIDEVSHRFIEEVQKPSPEPAAENPFAPSHMYSTSSELHPTGVNLEKDEDIIRTGLEKAVSSTIDLFRQVDQQQLSHLGASTDLTGFMVERLIERYIAQRFHASFLFPRLSKAHSTNDRQIDEHIRRMKHLDVSQVGMVIENGRQAKEEVLNRLDKGVLVFARMRHTNCPQDMLNILLTTVKAMTTNNGKTYEPSKKSLITVNADALVSLLLMVLVRTRVSCLETRLIYMQKFIFMDDVESGETGYALSTFEAVLTYILRDSIGLRKASAKNKRLWRAAKEGRISELKAILLRDFSDFHDADSDTIDSTDEEDNIIDLNPEEDKSTQAQPRPPLAHVFPFQTWAQPLSPNASTRAAKRVRMSSDARSLSESSTTSAPLSTDFPPWVEENENDVSPHSLVKTQNALGDSILMMTVKAKRPETLEYLLGLKELITTKDVLEDINREGVTLLIAAVQLSDAKSTNLVMDYLSRAEGPKELAKFLAHADVDKRTVAHYLFNLPSLMSRLQTALPWRYKDKTGRTPLFTLLRSYDHPDYNIIVHSAITFATKSQDNGAPLCLDEHADDKGNTLLHIIHDPRILYRVLTECDCDPNASNNKRFTPLMMASKYGRIQCIEILLADPRVDIHLRESRGLSAVELAKDDYVRNRIDDMILFSNLPPNPSDPTQRVTTVVRANYTEDTTFRCTIKSGVPQRSEAPVIDDYDRDSNHSDAPAPNSYLMTTCRRNLEDFYNLLRFLRIEHPASYIPALPDYFMPFQMPLKPCRALVNEITDRLDFLLKALLAHPTFSTHEMLWEFFLVPELRTELVEDRSQRKAAVLAESISDDYRAANKDGIREIERLVAYSRDAVKTVHHNSAAVIQNGHQLHNATCGFGEALALFAYELSRLKPPANTLPMSYVETFSHYASHISTSSLDTSHLVRFITAFTSLHSTTTAMLESLSRPHTLMAHLESLTRTLARSQSSLASSSAPRKFNIPVLEDVRIKSVRELEAKVLVLTNEIEQLSKEISWNKNVLVGELAGWTSWREDVGKQMIKSFARSTLIQERERKKRLERCLTNLRGSKPEPSSAS